MTSTTIRIESADHGGNTNIAVNGRVRKIQHNTDTPVNDGELDVLRNSHVEFKIVGEQSPTAGEAVPGDAASPDGFHSQEPKPSLEEQRVRVEGDVDPVAAKAEADAAGEADAAALSDGDLNGRRFDANATLDQSIARISEDMDEFSARQVRSLIAAENKRETPRSTLIDALERKLASLDAA